MKKIGFIDYYLSEWHANNYPGWIAQVSEKLGVDYKVCYGWAEKDVSPVDSKTTAQWCAEFGIEQCETIAQVCEKSDYVIILSPSDPEKHLKYCSEVFKFGKRTYVDKTFAPDYKTALEIFDLAKAYNTPFFTTSALRYADELDSTADLTQLIVKGGGSNLPEYIIHQIEIAVKCLGCGAGRLRAVESEENTAIDIEYCDGKKARLCYNRSYKFCVETTDNTGKTAEIRITSDYFKNLITKIILFFETGESDFSHDETAQVMKIREKAIAAALCPGKWLEF